MQPQINTSPLTQFTHTLRAAELSQQKEIKIPITQARLLNLALTEVLIKLNQNNENILNELRSSPSIETISVSMDGGGFTE